MHKQKQSRACCPLRKDKGQCLRAWAVHVKYYLQQSPPTIPSASVRMNCTKTAKGFCVMMMMPVIASWFIWGEGGRGRHKTSIEKAGNEEIELRVLKATGMTMFV